MKLDRSRSSTVPLHRQVAQCIHDDIMQRNLAAHTKIPSEVELAQQYGVSHGTITKALESLVRAHVLYRQRPQGTFVADPIITADTGVSNDTLLTTTARQLLAPQQEQPALEAVKPAISMMTNITTHVAASPTQTADPSLLAYQATNMMFIGILLPSLKASFTATVLTSVETMTRTAGYGLVFAHSESNITMERYHVEQFLKQGVAGIIIFPGEHQVEEVNGRLVSASVGQLRIDYLRMLQNRNVPFVLVDRYVPEIDCSYIISDDYAAGYGATQHLIALGRKRIGFVTAHYHLTSSYYRYIGYCQCLKDYKIPYDDSLVLRALQYPDLAIENNRPFVDNVNSVHDREQISAYLSQVERPDAVIAMNDLIAFQTLKAAEKAGIIVPDDLALVCSGETTVGTVYSRVIPFTSIIQPIEEIGRQSASLILSLVAGRIADARKIILPVSLIVRQSSGGAPNNIPQFLPRHHYSD